MDDLLYDITGLVGICLLPEPDDSICNVYNEPCGDKESDKIISILCHIDTLFFSNFIHADTFFFPY